jgi:ATP-dependent Clp protease ATP-binding subunit ClpX
MCFNILKHLVIFVKQKINQMNKNSKEIRCSFCGAGKQDSLMLIAGLDAHICDKCVNQANEILAEELKVRKVKTSPATPGILKPAK